MYTEESYLTFKNALDQANDLLTNEKATQDQIDEALANLQTAVDGLIPIEESEAAEDTEDSDRTGEQKEPDKNNEDLVIESETNEGKELPKTATDHYNWLLIGFVIISFGTLLLWMKKRKVN